MRKAYSQLLTSLDQFHSQALQSQQQDLLRARESTHKLTANTLQDIPDLPQALLYFSKLLPMMSNNFIRSLLTKDFIKTLVISTNFMQFSPSGEPISTALQGMKSLLWTFLLIDPLCYFQNYPDFTISHLGYRISFQQGMKLFLIVFSKGWTAVADKGGHEDSYYQRTNQLKTTSKDCLNMFFESFWDRCCTETDLNIIKSELIELMEAINKHIPQYSFTEYPEALQKLLLKYAADNSCDEGKLKQLLLGLNSLAEKNYSLLDASKRSYNQSKSHSYNPLTLTLSRYFAKIFCQVPCLVTLSKPELKSLLDKLSQTLTTLNDLSFLNILECMTADQILDHNCLVFNTIGQFTQELTLSMISDLNKEEFINTVKTLMRALCSNCIEANTSETVVAAGNFAFTLGKKIGSLSMEFREQFSACFIPLLERAQTLLDRFDLGFARGLYESIALTMPSEEAFNHYKELLSKRFVECTSKEEIEHYLKVVDFFFGRCSLKYFKLYFNDVHKRLIEESCIATLCEYYPLWIDFSLNTLNKKPAGQLKAVGILNIIWRVLALFKIYIQSRRSQESPDKPSVIPAYKCYQDIVGSINLVISKDQDLIESFSKFRGYEKFCQESLAYGHTDFAIQELTIFLYDLCFSKVKTREDSKVSSLSEMSPIQSHSELLEKSSNELQSGELTHRKRALNSLKQSDITLGLIAGCKRESVMPERGEVWRLVLPQLLSQVITHLLPYVEFSITNKMLGDLLSYAKRNLDSLGFLTKHRILELFTRHMIESREADKASDEFQLLLSLLKRDLTISSFKMIADSYFYDIETQPNPFFLELNKRLDFTTSEQTYSFSSSINLTNDSKGINNFLYAPDINLLSKRIEKEKNCILELDSYTYSAWVSRDKSVQDSLSPLYLFKLSCTQGDSVVWMNRLVWQKDELWFRSEAPKRKNLEEKLYSFKVGSQLAKEHKALHIVLCVAFNIEKKSMKLDFYLQGQLVVSKFLNDAPYLNFKQGQFSKDDKKYPSLHMGIGYKDPERDYLVMKSEIASFKEIFLYRGCLTPSIVEALFITAFSKDCQFTGWSESLHQINLQSLYSNSSWSSAELSVDQNLDPVATDEFSSCLHLNLDLRRLFSNMAFLVDSKQTLVELPEEALTPQDSQKLKQAMQFKAPIYLAGGLETRVVEEDGYESPCYLIYFAVAQKEFFKPKFEEVVKVKPCLDYLFQSQSIMKRFLATLENCPREMFIEILQGFLSSFKYNKSLPRNSILRQSLVTILEKREVNIPSSMVSSLLEIYLLESQVTNPNGNDENFFILADNIGLRLLTMMFFKNSFRSLLAQFLKVARELILKESPALK
jgi:hypothetical protein